MKLLLHREEADLARFGTLGRTLTRLRAEHGVAVLGNFRCCLNCALHALTGEGVTDEDRYVLWHAQDHDRAVAEKTLWLAFGGPGTGALTVKALRADGFRVAWNHDPARRIQVSGLDESFEPRPLECSACVEDESTPGHLFEPIEGSDDYLCPECFADYFDDDYDC